MAARDEYATALARVDAIIAAADSWWDVLRHAQVKPYRAARDYVVANTPGNASDALYEAAAAVLDRLALMRPLLFNDDGTQNRAPIHQATRETVVDTVEAVAGPIGGPIVQGLDAYKTAADQAARDAGTTLGGLWGLTPLALVAGVGVLGLAGYAVYRATKKGKR